MLHGVPQNSFPNEVIMRRSADRLPDQGTRLRRLIVESSLCQRSGTLRVRAWTESITSPKCRKLVDSMGTPGFF